MGEWTKILLAVATAGFIAFQGWLAVAALNVGTMQAVIDENRRERADQVKELRDEVRDLRDTIEAHRLRDATDDRGGNGS